MYRYNPDEYIYPSCDSCQVLVINNIATHETGCPKSWINPITGEPYLKECLECGSNFEPKNTWEAYNRDVCDGCIDEEYIEHFYADSDETPWI